jgi:hypothetical protein
MLKMRQPNFLEPRAVDLTAPPIAAATSLSEIDAPSIHRRALATKKRDLRDLRRATSCRDAIGELDAGVEIYGFTKGQFSVIDIINHCLDQIGPASLSISTWTAATSDVTTVLELVESGRLTSARWLVDLTFNRRSPELAQRIRKVFGRKDAIRVAQNHAKFVMLGNDAWKIVCRTSMNLNFNPRFENFQLANDPELYDFHEAIFAEIWKRQPAALADADRPSTAQAFFRDKM